MTYGPEESDELLVDEQDIDEMPIDSELDEENVNVDVPASNQFDNTSIISQLARTYDDFIGRPAVEQPLTEYVQRSASSGLPDGSTILEGNTAPLGENLDKFIARLSRQAALAWDEWTTPIQQEGLVMPTEGAKPLQGDIASLMLEKEADVYQEVKRLRDLETAQFREEEASKVYRRVSECTGFTKTHTPGQVENRYYDVVTTTRNQFGELFTSVQRIDRCKGKPEVKCIEGVSPSDVDVTTYNPSIHERIELINMTNYQTSIWRKAYRSEEDMFLPNAFSPLDDLDFIPPSSLNSRNFIVYPPASRPYNTVFKVYYNKNPALNGKQGKFQLNELYLSSKKLYPTSKKDYASLSSIEYMLKQKGMKDFTVVIDEIRVREKSFPCCKFEIDLRVTYGDELIPDPNNYKKVDPESVLGQKLLQLLNEQPYLWNEHVWNYEEVDEDGSKYTDKIYAVSFKITNPRDTFGKRVYWVYLNKDANTMGVPSFLRKRLTPPQYLYKPYKVKGGNREIPFTATVRVSDEFYYYDKAGNSVSFKQVVAEFKKVMLDKGYLFVRQEPEDLYTNIQLFHFVHKDMCTREQRKQAFVSLTKKDE